MLELEKVEVRSGREILLDGVSLAVARGSIHAIVGPNGAGKSTLISAVLGRVPFSGSIRCRFEKKEARVGHVPQAFARDRTLAVTVAEFLALSRQTWPPVALGIKKALRARIDALLERVGLGGFGRKPLTVLSGGEMQRVLFANAIDPAPELLILDEPASGLDRAASERLESMLGALKRDSGATVLLVSHDLHSVRRIADRASVLDKRVLKDGAPAEVLGAGAGLPWTS